MTKLARAMGILNWFGKDLDKVEGIVEKLPTTFFRDRAPRPNRESRPANLRAAYFVGCGFNFVLPQVSEATLEVLSQVGARVQVTDKCCCGLPAYGYGDLEAARKMAVKNLAALESLEADVVVTECGSCSAFLKDYPELFAGDAALEERARKVAQKVRSVSEFMQNRLPEAALGKPLSGMAYRCSIPYIVCCAPA